MDQRNTKKTKKKANKSYPYKLRSRRLTPLYIEGVDCPVLSQKQALNQIRKDLPSIQENAQQNAPKQLKTLNQEDSQPKQDA